MLAACPIVRVTARARSNSAAVGAPTMNVSVPARAPFGPPDTGASTKWPRRESCTFEASSSEVFTSIVEHSRKNFGDDAGGGEMVRRPFAAFVKTSRT